MSNEFDHMKTNINEDMTSPEGDYIADSQQFPPRRTPEQLPAPGISRGIRVPRAFRSLRGRQRSAAVPAASTCFRIAPPRANGR